MKRFFTFPPSAARDFHRRQRVKVIAPDVRLRRASGLQLRCLLVTLVVVGVLSPAPSVSAAPQKLQLQTSAFQSGGFIPGKYTCSGENISPALSWTNPPRGTTAFALIVTDPDAPAHTWVHWVIYNLPPTVRQLPEGVSKAAEIQGGGLQGSNDFRDLGYGGPCPPPGNPHRYFFRLYALDAHLNLKSGATRREVEKAMRNHILAEAELMGRYGR